MFRFRSPEYFYLLLWIPVAIFLHWYAFVKKKKALEQFAGRTLFQKLARTRSPRRQNLKAALLLAATVAMLVGLARPQFGTRVETMKREGQDIFVALDVSLSMLAEDIRPNRLEKAKRDVSALIDQLEGDRIGLIAFAGEAFVQCPLTLDYSAAKLFLSAMTPELISTQGTALGSAIKRAIDSFVGAEAKSRVLVVITDGENHDGKAREVAKEAGEAGIVVHTIGIGTPQGVPIPIVSDSGGREGFKKDRQGEFILTKLDEPMLREVAKATGGRYYSVSQRGGEIGDLYQTVAGMERTELSTRQVTLFDEKFQIVAALGLIFLTVEFLVSESRRESKEWRGRFQ